MTIILESMLMALDGHRFVQTPQKVHDEMSVIQSLFSLFISISPCGHTPTQTSSEQLEHLALSKEIGKLDLSISSQQLNKYRGYISCARLSD